MHPAIARCPLTSAWAVICSPPNPPQFTYWAWCPMVGNISSASSGQLSWPCSLPASCAPTCWQSMGNWKILNLATNNKCVIGVILTINLIHITIPATKKWTTKKRKLALSQPKNRTTAKSIIHIFMLMSHCWISRSLQLRGQFYVWSKNIDLLVRWCKRHTEMFCHPYHSWYQAKRSVGAFLLSKRCYSMVLLW